MNRVIYQKKGKTLEFSADLFQKGSVERLISELESYRDGLKARSMEFVSRLADIGIRAAERHLGDYAGMVEFTKELDDGNAVCMLIGRDKQKVISRWRYKGDWKEAEVSPLLMSEFGSGWFAEVIFPVAEGEVGQGTFPGQKHAFDEQGWHWTDGTGYHISYGEQPTHPMFNAWLQMRSQIETVAKNVFW